MSGPENPFQSPEVKSSPLVPLCLAFIFGLVLGEGFLYFPLSLSCIALAILLGEALYFRGRLVPFSLIFVGTGAFLFYQFVSTPFSKNDLSAYVDQGPISILAEVTAPIRHAPGYHRLQMKALSLQSKKERIPVSGVFQLKISGKAPPIRYGDQLEMRIRLRRPQQYDNPGAFLYADYLERTGWSGVASLSDFRKAKKLGEGGNPLLKPIFRWRERIRKRILASFSRPTAAMMLAMVIGETGYLDDETREAFIRSGTAHLLAVSGAHLAFVSLLVFSLVRWVLLRLPEAFLLRLSLWKIPSQWAALFTAFAAIFYTFLAGARTGTLRALTMILIYLFSIWTGRQRDAKISLALAALLILVFNPHAIFEIAFQFSFLSVLSILLFMEWWQETATSGSPALDPGVSAGLKNRALQSLRFLFLSSSSAALGLAPLTLFYFHQFSWIGLFSNLLLLPFAGWVLIPLSLISALTSLFMVEGFPLLGLHEGLWSLFFRLIALFSDLPGADLHFPSPTLLSVLIFYGGMFWIFAKQKPRKWLAIFVSVSLLLFLLSGGIRFSPGVLRLSFLDVGQGDAALIEFPQGQTMLIDAGNRRAGKFAVAPFLWERNIRTIDTLVASHPQNDHIGGMPYLLRHFKVKEVWTNGMARDIQADQSLRALIEKKALRHRIITGHSPSLEIEGCGIQFLNGASEAHPMKTDVNNASIVFRLSCLGKKPFSVLFPGDIEAELELALVKAKSDLKSMILKVPHHGSRSSSGADFLSAVSPEVAIFSVGRKNRYGHPHSGVLRRYQAIGTQIYRSDEKGAILIEVDLKSEGPGSGLKISTYRDQTLERMLGANLSLEQEWDNMKRLFRRTRISLR